MLLTVLLLGSGGGLCAQKYRFREYRQEQGLENLALTALAQDREKYLWVGTQNGLFRFDGAEFVRFGTKEGLPASYVLSLALAPDGILWVHTHQGLAVRREGGFETVYSFREAADSPGMGLSINRNGVVFASTPGGLMIGRRTGSRYTYHFDLLYLPGELRSKRAYQIGIDWEGRAWVGCGRGVCEVREDGSYRYWGKEAGIGEEQWDGVYVDGGGRIWLRSQKRLLRAERGGRMWAAVGNVGSSFEAALIFGDGEKVYLPEDAGLRILQEDGREVQRVGPENGLTGGTILGVCRDHERNLWIAYLGDGLARWLGYEEWEGWTTSEGLNSNVVWTLLRDRQGVLWAGGDAGVNLLEPQARRWKTLSGSREMGRVMSLATDAKGMIWAASLYKGLMRIDPVQRRWERIGYPAARKGSSLYSVVVDRNEDLWLGGSDGLYRATVMQPLMWHQPAPVVPGETVYTVTVDEAGRIWSAGNHGVLMGHEGRWQRFDRGHGLLSNSTWFARSIQPGRVFVGYLESGLNTLIDVVDGLPQFYSRGMSSGGTGRMHYFIGWDRKKRLWVGTDAGVVVEEGHVSFSMTDQEGLLWNDCNSNAFLADEDGSVWIGTTRGLAHGRLAGSLAVRAPPLRVAGIRVNGAPQAAEGMIRLPAEPNALTLKLSPLTFRYAERMEYQVRMGEETTQWETQPGPVISFGQVPGGVGRIQVRARVADQAWSDVLVDWPVEVAVPVWKRSWALALMVLVVAGMCVLLWRYRHQQLIAEKTRLAEAVAARTSEIERLLAEARETNRLKTEFLANMSHEIRTPMNGVLGMLQLVSDTDLSDEQREFIRTAKVSGESLLHLINEVLDLSKVESGFLELDRSAAALREIVERVGRLLLPAARAKGIALEVAVARDVPSLVWVDGARLQQVLVNLVGNGVKFTGEGKVSLEVSLDDGGAVCFSVRDTGIGISAEQQRWIFDAFRQADGSTTRRFGGTGLGLAISQRLVGLMGGEIRVESEPGKGSRFWFALPLVEAPLTETPEITAEVVVVEPLRVLLVEDNRVNQIVASKMLERDGHQVTLAADGEKAIEEFDRGSFDVVLMDVHMPVLDGIRATERIRQRDGAGRDVPILALSAGVLEQERARCTEAGMNGFLAKPLRPEELRKALHAIKVPPPPASNRS